MKPKVAAFIALLLLAALTAAKAFGVEGKEVADFSRQLADLYRVKGDGGKAEESYLRAISIWAKTAGAGREDARVEMAVERVMCTADVDHEKLGRRIEAALGGVVPFDGGELYVKAISKPPPKYPDAAKARHIMGTVVLKIWVDEAGAVMRVNVVCGDPILAQASVEAARGARFSPTLLDGKPVKVWGLITYRFVLQ
jgi:TonB family protein